MRALDLDKPSQGVDYELVPAYAQDGSQTWEIMIYRAPFGGSKIRYNNVQLDGEGDETQLNFNFDVIETEYPELVNDENAELQQFAADILIDVIELAIKDGSIGASEANVGNQSTTDDSTESID